MTIKRALALATMTILVTACGGSSHSQGLTHSQLVKRANAFCAKANAQAAQQKRAQTPAQVAVLAAHLKQIADNLIPQLQSLHASSSDRAGYEKYVQDLRRGDQLLGQLHAAAGSANIPKARQVLGELDASPDDRDARAVGLSVCAEPITPQG